MGQKSINSKELHNLDGFASLLDYASQTYSDCLAYSYEIGTDIQNKTFTQLRNDVKRVAFLLEYRGFSGNKIAILSNNSYQYIVVFLAVICSGNIAVPINKDIDKNELALILNDCHPELIIYSDDIAVTSDDLRLVKSNFALYNISELAIGEAICENSEIDSYIWSCCGDNTENSSPCCIIYTSGTSGIPKGVLLSQTNILNNVVSFVQRMPMKGSVMLCLPLHHMYAWTASVLMPIACGLRVIVNQDSRTFGRDLRNFSPDNFIVVPAMLEFYYKRIKYLIKKSDKSEYYFDLLENDSLLGRKPEERRRLFSEFTAELGSQLKCAVCGAAMLDRDMLLFFQKIGIEIYGAYGMTECSPIVTVCGKDFNCIGSVGQPLDCNEIRIDNPNEDGIGEICVRGSNVMQGYYLRDADTAAVFDGEWLRSGDLGYLDEHGCLFIKGRLKNLIIRSSGENVSPEELEQKLINIADVDEVLVCEERGLIVAKIFSKRLSDEKKKQIRQDVSELNLTIPAYKRVDKVEFVDSPFERTSTNKIKRF